MNEGLKNFLQDRVDIAKENLSNVEDSISVLEELKSSLENEIEELEIEIELEPSSEEI